MYLSDGLVGGQDEDVGYRRGPSSCCMTIELIPSLLSEIIHHHIPHLLHGNIAYHTYNMRLLITLLALFGLVCSVAA
jgi:hypothetical protein